MRNKKLLLVSTIGLLCLLLLFAGMNNAVTAEEFPEDDMTMIIPWPSGGFTDVAVRPFAHWFEDYFGENVVIDNIEGAGGVIGSQAIEDADPDGHTFGTTSISTVTARLTAPDPPDMDKVDALGQIFTSPATLTVNADSEWETIDEFVEFARENPGTVTVANTGVGASVHIFALAFEEIADIDVVHVPYDGSEQPTVAVLGGHVDATLNILPDVADHVRTGDLRMLAIGTHERHDDFPDVPTFLEEDYDFTMGNYTGFVIPTGVEEYRLDILEEAIAKAMEDEELIKHLEDAGYVPEYLNAEEFSEAIDQTVESIDEMIEEGLLDIEAEE